MDLMAPEKRGNRVGGNDSLGALLVDRERVAYFFGGRVVGKRVALDLSFDLEW